jgi:uncharacterized repeat protein (TIGR01451 family)
MGAFRIVRPSTFARFFNKELPQVKFVAIAIAAAGLAAAAAHAQAPTRANGPLETRLEQQKVARAADGKEVLAPAEGVRPGEVLEYTATYRNTGKQALKNVEATLPIPSNTEFVPGSVKPGNAKASLDGRAFADMPLKRTVTRGGKQVQEEVPAREYRALRWYPGELGPEKTVAYTARVKVIDDRPPTVAGQGGGR